MTDDAPSLDSLRAHLRESKALTANGQRMLDDPAGLKLLADYQDLIEEAKAKGRKDIEDKAWAILVDLLEKTANVERSQKVSDAAERNAVRVIIEEGGRS